MAPQSMELSTPLIIMRGKKSSEVVIWKWMNLACSIDIICAGRRENIIQLIALVFCYVRATFTQ